MRVFTWKYHQKCPWFDWITELGVRCPHYFKPWGKCLSRTQYPLQICSCYLVLFVWDVSGKTKAPLICLWILFVCILYQFLRDIYRVIVFFISLAVEAFVHYELEWSSLVLLCYCLLECVITEYLLCYITIVLWTCQPSTNCYQTGNNGVDYLCLYFCMLKKINIFGELNCRKK